MNKENIWRWVERGISLVVILGVVIGWIVTGTVNRTKAEAESEYFKAELAEIKEDIKDMSKSNTRINENADNITRLTTIVELYHD